MSHMSLPPPPVTNCHTFLDPLPLERDILYGRPPNFEQKEQFASVVYFVSM